MSQNLDPNMVMIVILILFIFMMWMSSRRMKKKQQQQEELREAMVPGTLVVLRGGIIATIVSVDEKYEEIVVDSEGSRLRFKLNAVAGKYVRPAFIDDDEAEANDSQQEDAGSEGAEGASAASETGVSDTERTDVRNASSADDTADTAAPAEAGEADTEDKTSDNEAK